MNILLITISVIILTFVILVIVIKTKQIRKVDSFTCKLKQEWILQAFWTRTLGVLIISNSDLDNIKSTVAKIGQNQNNIIDLIISESKKDKDIKVNREKIKNELIDVFNEHILLISETIYNLKSEKTIDQSELSIKIKANNDKVGKLLSELSSWITMNKARDLFGDYTDNIIAQFVSYKNKDWETGLYVTDDMINSVIILSNYITDALEY